MKGKIEVITGPMFAGKTTELLRRLERYSLAGKNVVVCKPVIDTRTGEYVTTASNRAQIKYPVFKIPVRPAKHLIPYADTIAFDEAQFFGETIVPLCCTCRREGKTVIISGLDMDHLGMPFGYMGQLMAISDTVTKLTAVCKCGREAIFTQRLSDGRPVHDEEIVKIGDKDIYEPRCSQCYE
jgi:thymidine kinase